MNEKIKSIYGTIQNFLKAKNLKYSELAKMSDEEISALINESDQCNYVIDRSTRNVIKMIMARDYGSIKEFSRQHTEITYRQVYDVYTGRKTILDAVAKRILELMKITQ